MIRKIFTLILAGLMIFGLSAFAFAEDSEQVQNQFQKQERIQTSINLEEQEWERGQLRERLHIDDAAILKHQERVQEQEQNQEHFSDIQGHWAKEKISHAYNWGIVNGYPDASCSQEVVV